MSENRLGSAFIEVSEDETIEVIYNNRAIANAERLMKKGILGVLGGFADGGSGVNEIAILLQVGWEEARRRNREGGKRIQQKDAFRVLDEIGLTAVAPPVFEAITKVITRDDDDAEYTDEDDAEKN